jgi:energy-converting hydrogenase A subunit O
MLPNVPTVADAVSTYASCDPCIACAERVQVLNRDNNQKIVRDMF